MNTINCDIYHLEESIEKMKNSEEIERIHVWDIDCVMRGISIDEMKERNILDRGESVCYLQEMGIGSFRFKFHQNQIDDYSEFCFRPPEPTEINAHGYCTLPEKLGDTLKEVVIQLEEMYSDLLWDLSKINGASIANGGHITDFEFEYEVVTVQ